VTAPVADAIIGAQKGHDRDPLVTRRVAWLSLVAFGLLAATFFLKTTGVHFDASSYLRIAYGEPLGDSAATAKPWLFYVLNYTLFNSVGSLLGRFRPLSLDLCYMAASAIGLAWAAARLNAGDSRFDALLRIWVVTASALTLVRRWRSGCARDDRPR